MWQKARARQAISGRRSSSSSGNAFETSKHCESLRTRQRAFKRLSVNVSRSSYLAHFEGLLVLVHAHESTGFARVTWQYGRRGGGIMRIQQRRNPINTKKESRSSSTLVKFFVDAHARVRVFKSLLPHFRFCVSGTAVGEQNVGSACNIDGFCVSDVPDLKHEKHRNKRTSRQWQMNTAALAKRLVSSRAH